MVETPEGDPPPKSTNATVRAADDLLDAATGFDRRALVTMRDLVLRPWTLIQRAVFDDDPRYVGPVKLALSLTVLSLLLTTWLLPTDYDIGETLHRDAPEQWAALRERMATHQISGAHFVERFTDYLHFLTTLLTLAECGFYALVLRRFDRSRPYLTHMGYALYLYSLWLLLAMLLVLVIAVAHTLGYSSLIIGAWSVMGVSLPVLQALGLPRFYPAPRSRQIGRAAFLIMSSLVLFSAGSFLATTSALVWALRSFGL